MSIEGTSWWHQLVQLHLVRFVRYYVSDEHVLSMKTNCYLTMYIALRTSVMVLICCGTIMLVWLRKGFSLVFRCYIYINICLCCYLFTLVKKILWMFTVVCCENCLMLELLGMGFVIGLVSVPHFWSIKYIQNTLCRALYWLVTHSIMFNTATPLNKLGWKLTNEFIQICIIIPTT